MKKAHLLLKHAAAGGQLGGHSSQNCTRQGGTRTFDSQRAASATAVVGGDEDRSQALEEGGT